MMITLDGCGPLYRQVYRGVRDAVLRGQLPPGARLPSSRALADELGLSRTVVLLAYEDLQAESYTETRAGAGTFVAPQVDHTLLSKAVSNDGLSNVLAADAAPRLSRFARRAMQQKPEAVYEQKQDSGLRFNFEYSVSEQDAQVVRLWRSLLAKHVTDSGAFYPSPQGELSLRMSVAKYAGHARGVHCDPGQILIVDGSQQSLDLIAKVLLDPGDRVLIEEPQYHGARAAFLAVGARLDLCPVDADGFDIALRPTNYEPGARLVYVTPSHQMPTGAVMTVARRLELLAWATDNSAYIVEDDYDSEFRYKSRPIPSLHSLDMHDRVIYLGTFAKAFSPTVRLAYMVLPAKLVAPFVSAKWLSDLGTPWLAQRALADYMDAGHYARRIRRLSRRYAARRSSLLAALRRYLGDEITIGDSSAGMHVLIWLNRIPPDRLPALIRAAARREVHLHSVASYYMNPPSRAGLLMGYTLLSEEEITEGVRRLGALLERFCRTKMAG
ncbi:MAG: PLP-dependent aminotransferase family protein [Gammaproteobacteria bacterium]|nr:PLP-dependent aminotransferase family protein [Gammaproteobacteria bacterium]